VATMDTVEDPDGQPRVLEREFVERVSVNHNTYPVKTYDPIKLGLWQVIQKESSIETHGLYWAIIVFSEIV
jgi:hypothetical protein